MFAFRAHTKSFASAFALCSLLAASAQAGTTVIDFDHDAYGNPLNAPGFYAYAQSLTTLYAPLGVTFSGPGGVGSNTGGAILNSKSGSFSVPPRSGANFLCFKTGDTASGPETITFAQAATNVTIYASSPGAATFTMTGYNSAGATVAVSTVSMDPYVTGNFTPYYVKLSVDAPVLSSISAVVLTETAPNPYFIIYHYDDLSFTVAPTPATIAGTLQLDGIAPTAPAKPFTFELRPADGSAVSTQTVSVAPNGQFNLTPVAPKAYTLHIKGDHYLAANVSVDATGGSVSGVAARLLAGDINGDNSVNTTDFGLLVGTYGDSYDPNSPSAPAGDMAADLNGDGSVDTTDFGLLVGTYGRDGAK